MTKFEIQYEELVTRVMLVEADSVEEAKEKAYEGEAIDSWEDNTSNFRILDAKKVED